MPAASPSWAVCRQRAGAAALIQLKRHSAQLGLLPLPCAAFVPNQIGTLKHPARCSTCVKWLSSELHVQSPDDLGDVPGRASCAPAARSKTTAIAVFTPNDDFQTGLCVVADTAGCTCRLDRGPHRMSVRTKVGTHDPHSRQDGCKHVHHCCFLSLCLQYCCL